MGKGLLDLFILSMSRSQRLTKEVCFTVKNSLSKLAIHHSNVDNPERCLVRLFTLYNSKCPRNRPDEAFYLRPLIKPKGDIWYTSTPIGHNVLSKTRSSMTLDCKGIIPTIPLELHPQPGYLMLVLMSSL